MKYIAITLFMVIYFLTNYYILRKIRLWDIIDRSKNRKKLVSIIYFVVMLTPIVVFGVSGTNIGSILGIIGNYGIGIYFFLFTLFLVTDLILLVLKKTKLKENSFSKKVNKYIGFSLIGIIFALGFYGNYNASQISEVSYDLNIDKKESTMKELKAVLITDIHLGYMNGVEHLSRIVQGINEINPDIVFISGDIFDANYYSLTDSNEARDLFKKIETKYGIYASLGNHDVGSSYDEMIKFLRDSKVKLLRDEKINIDNKFIVVGRKDSQPIGGSSKKRKNIENILKDSDMNLPVIVLDHRPSNFKEYKRGEDLILSGHTHAGQIVPFNIITNKVNLANYGHYQEKNNITQMIVSSGVGTWGPPLRIGTENEIVSLNIKFK